MREWGYVNWRIFDDGTIYAVMPMLLGNGRIVVDVDAYGSADFYCYDGVLTAIEALWAWNPDFQDEPSGWKRHYATGRRRPGGDPAKEFISM